VWEEKERSRKRRRKCTEMKARMRGKRSCRKKYINGKNEKDEEME
jgi:hypothetical protein